MRIAGVDPGTIRAGVGIVESERGQVTLLYSDTIHADERKPIAERLKVIFDRLRKVFEDWKPDVVALEGIFYQKDFKAAIKVGEARACAILAAELSGAGVVEYAPARIKQSVCGNGRAAKEQIQYMVRHLLRLKAPLPIDSSDALACALCHFHMNQVTPAYTKRPAYAL